MYCVHQVQYSPAWHELLQHGCTAGAPHVAKQGGPLSTRPPCLRHSCAGALLQVLELPPGGVLLASSRTAPVEMFTVPAGNVLAVQGHAELTAEDTLTKIHPAITAAGRLSAGEGVLHHMMRCAMLRCGCASAAHTHRGGVKLESVHRSL